MLKVYTWVTYKIHAGTQSLTCNRMFFFANIELTMEGHCLQTPMYLTPYAPGTLCSR